MIQGHLRRFPRFDCLDEHQIQVLERAFTAERCWPEQVLIRKGDSAHGGSAAVFLVLEGSVEIQSAATRVVARGELLGLIALVQDTRRTATITVRDKALVARLDRDGLQRLQTENPEVWARFQEVIARQLAADFRAVHAQLSEAI